MRMRKKKNLNPRMEACQTLWIREPAAHRGRWRELKPDAAMVRLELGCGKGRFTAETAADHLEDLYIAVERVPDAMVIAMERCRERGLTNVFFIDGDAARLSDYFAPDEVDLIYINFCDPWPSVKHSKRRLTHEGFLLSYREVLRNGGQIHFKTDNHDLFEWSLFQFPKAGYELSEVTRNLHEHGVRGVMTDYEEKFHSMGTPINRCVGTKGALPQRAERRGPEAVIRPMADGDRLAVLRLSRQWADEGITYGYHADELADLKGYRIWVAELDGNVIGYAAGQMETAKRDSSIQKTGDRWFELEELYVTAGHRSEGIGRVLLRTVEDELRREGVGRMMLIAANRDHEPLLRFYLEDDMTVYDTRLFKDL